MQSKQWNHPGSPLPIYSVGKVVASVFWDSQGVIMIDYLDQGRTINGAYYTGELRRLRQEVARKGREKLAVFCSCRTTPLPIRHKLPQIPYSPDMAPFDFYLFTKLKAMEAS